MTRVESGQEPGARKIIQVFQKCDRDSMIGTISVVSQGLKWWEVRIRSQSLGLNPGTRCGTWVSKCQLLRYLFFLRPFALKIILIYLKIRNHEKHDSLILVVIGQLILKKLCLKSGNSNMEKTTPMPSWNFHLTSVQTTKTFPFSVINDLAKSMPGIFESWEQHLIQTEKKGPAFWRDWHLIWRMQDKGISSGDQGSKSILVRGNCLEEGLKVGMWKSLVGRELFW